MRFILQKMFNPFIIQERKNNLFYCQKVLDKSMQKNKNQTNLTDANFSFA